MSQNICCRNGDASVITLDADRVAYIINFLNMEELPEDPNAPQEPITVIRQNKIAGGYIMLPYALFSSRGGDV
jgi:hypothetical protein